jgi:hypothetical protein
MAVMILFVMMFSAIFIVFHTDHDCTGEDCPVCACLQQCENILHGAGDGSQFTASGIIPFVLITGFILVSSSIVISDTPVSAKVRMNN